LQERGSTMQTGLICGVLLSLIVLSNSIPARPTAKDGTYFDDQISFIEKPGGGGKSPCDSLKAKAACDGNTSCTWCSGKWYSQCFSLTEANGLSPGAGFVCDSTPDSNKTQLCDDYKTEDTCMTSNCSWCINTWFSKCYNASEAAGLPPAYFKCHNNTPPASCSVQPEKSCLANSTCSWCSGKGSSSVKSECYEMDVAQDLPFDFFNCSGVKPKPPPPPPPHPTPKPHPKPTPKPKPTVQCDTLPEAKCLKQSQCEWCSGDYVIPKCFEVAMAEKLPKTFFKCSKPPKKKSFFLAMEEQDEDGGVETVVVADQEAGATPSVVPGDERECVMKPEATCDDSVKCEWCRMEFYSMCFSRTIADELPGFIFNCSKTPSA